MWTILLDIDGTLVRTRGAGLQAIRGVMNRHFGVSDLPPLQVHGCTDFGIWTSIFDQLGLKMPSDMSHLIDEYCDLLTETLASVQGDVLPGVPGFLSALKSQNDVAIGLLTGNAQRAAGIKMEHFELSEFVENFGGFGDFDADRNAVAARAFTSCRQHLGKSFDPAKVWVIGDTVRDIQCARSIGANVLAVETGGDDSTTLSEAKPDLQVSKLTNHESICTLLGL